MKKTLLILALLLAASPAAQAQDPFDLNKDGKVNVGDVTTLVNHLLGRDKPKPEEPEPEPEPVPVETDAAVEAGLCPDVHHPHLIDMGEAGKWACCNVGAGSPLEHGGHYAWGETEEKSDYSAGTYEVATGEDIGGNKQYDVAAAKWGGHWRMPTHELNLKLLACSNEWATIGDVGGRLFTAANGNRLFLPAAGFYSDTYLNLSGSFGLYWSSTPYPTAGKDAYDLVFGYGGSNHDYDDGEHGFSVRPVAE